MRLRPTAVNRTGVLLAGMALTVAGALWLALALGLWPATGPAADSPVLEGLDLVGAAGLGWPAYGLCGIGVLLALLGLLWLIRQVPRRAAAKPLRLHADGRYGTTTVPAGVLADAVARQVEALPGAAKADAVVRGTAASPELVIRVTADERADLGALRRRITGESAQEAAVALERPLAYLGIQMDIGRGGGTSRYAVIE